MQLDWQGIKIPGYRIEKEIGRGGMASVYLARQLSLDRRVALKILAPEFARDEGFTRRFIAEGATVAKLRHQKIIEVFDTGVAQDHYFLSMAYLPGGTLSERIDAGLSIAETTSIIKDIAEALGYAHSQNIIHRDVKPHNILFSEEGSPMLTDFGIAKATDASTSITGTGMALGSPRYMSPEQIRGEPVDHRCDLYALGIVLFQMLSGRLPFDAQENMAIAYQHVSEPIPKLTPGLIMFQPLLEQLMAKRREQRFATASDFLQMLERIEFEYRARFETAAQPALQGITGALAYDLPDPAETPEREQKSQTSATVFALVVALLLSVGLVSAGYFSWGWLQERAQIKALEKAEQTALQLAKERQKLLDDALSRAGEALTIGDFPATLAALDAGLERLPDALELSELRADVVSRRARTLLRQYEQRAAEQSLRQDARIYRLALQRRVSQLQEQAEQALQAQDYDKSLTLIDRGLLILPDSDSLVVMRRHLDQRVAAIRQKIPTPPPTPEDKPIQPEVSQVDNEIEALLAKAEAQFADHKLTSPASDNAHDTYSRVLAMAPGNAAATAGLKQIARKYGQWARQNLNAGNLGKAENYVDKGLLILADDPELKKTRAKIAAARQAARSRKPVKSKPDKRPAPKAPSRKKPDPTPPPAVTQKKPLPEPAPSNQTTRKFGSF